MAVFIQQAVIHAPSVDAKGIQIPITSLAEGQKALLELIVEVRRVPIEYPVHLYIVVFKPVQLRHGQLFTVILS